MHNKTVQCRVEVSKRRGITLAKQSFIQGTLILLAAGIVNRILGFIPRVVLPRIMGAEGVGIYQLGYPFLIVIITLITGGIPLAVAKLIAEADALGDQSQVKRVLTLAMKVTTGVAVMFAVTIFILAPWITTYAFTDRRVYYTFLVMTPIIVIVAASSVLRGYFQGMQNMIPTATSQIVETLIRIVTVILFAYIGLPYGLVWAAAGAMAGVVIGEIAGLAVLIGIYYMPWHQGPIEQLSLNKDRTETVYTLACVRGIWRRMLQISLPVTGSKLIGSISYFMESIAIVRSLAAAGVINTVATAQYGALQGMIIPIITLPGALTYSLAISLIPALSEALGRQDFVTIRRRIHQALRFALLSGAPFAIVMFVLAAPLCLLLYNDASIAPMLKWMAPVAVLIYLQTPLQAVLQALEQPTIALVNTLIGAFVKIGLIVWLASYSSLGIIGAIIAINVNVILVTTLHGYSVIRHVKLTLPWLDIVKVATTMIITAGSIQAIYISLPSLAVTHFPLRLILSCMIGLVIYFLLLVFIGLLDRDDISHFPLFHRLLYPKANLK